MAGLMVAWAIFKACAAGLVLGGLLIVTVLFGAWLGMKATSPLKPLGRLLLNSLLPTDWAKEKREGAIAFCGEVWYDVPVAAEWITLDRWGLIQCWQARPTYCSEDGEWFGPAVNRPHDMGHMAEDWYMPFMGSATPPMLQLPEDIYGL